MPSKRCSVQAALPVFFALLLGPTVALRHNLTSKRGVTPVDPSDGGATTTLRVRIRRLHAKHTSSPAASAHDDAELRSEADGRLDASGPVDRLVHILYTVDSAEDMDLAVSTAVFSGLYNMHDPGRLRYHFVVPEHSDRVAICETLLAFAAKRRVRQGGRMVDFVAEWDDVTKFYTDEEAAGHQTSRDRREWSDCLGSHSKRARSCLCGSPQFHFMSLNRHTDILPKIKQQVDLFSSYENVGHGDAVRLSSVCNFARNFAPEILADKGDIPKVIYMDADTVVQGDLSELWETPMRCGKYIQMANDVAYTHMIHYYNKEPKIIKYMFEDHKDLSNLNAGMIVMALAAMAKDRIHLGQKITHLIDYHAHTEELWLKGIQQPSFNLAALPYIEVIDGQWNQRLKAYGPCQEPDHVEAGKILHWTGKYKPWLQNGCFKDLWEQYSISRTHLERTK